MIKSVVEFFLLYMVIISNPKRLIEQYQNAGNMKKALFLLVWISLGLQLGAQAVYWEVTAPNGQISHLLGTYHLLGDGFIRHDDEMFEHFQKSDAVAVEVLIDSLSAIKVAQAGMMKEGSLRALTDSAAYHRLSAIMEPLIGVPLSMVDQLMPMNLALVYGIHLAQRAMPAKLQFAGEPLDMYLGNEAVSQGKQVVALETLEEQVTLLFGAQSPKEQMKELLKLLEDTAQSRLDTEKLIMAYAAGDLHTILVLSEMAQSGMGDMEVWLDDRNKQWIPQLLPLLAQGNAFIAVGALHLPGENGLLALIEAEGYQLRPLP